MEHTRYGMNVVADASVEDAERKTREALQREGFGVLTEIDADSCFHATSWCTGRTIEPPSRRSTPSR